MTSTMRFDRWQNSLGQPYGTVLQVVQAVKTDTFSTASTSMTDITGLVATITPRFATSKILIQLNIGSVDVTTDNLIAGDVTRNGTVIGVGDAGPASVIRAGWGVGIVAGNKNLTPSYSFLDSPATTSPMTYQARMKNFQGTGFLNRSSGETNSTTFSRTISTITLMEIAQ
jgi:hypothetical protein